MLTTLATGTKVPERLTSWVDTSCSMTAIQSMISILLHSWALGRLNSIHFVGYWVQPFSVNLVTQLKPLLEP